MRDILLLASVPLVSVTLALGLGLAARKPADPGGAAALLVITPPWRTKDAVVAAAGGVLLPGPRAPLAALAVGPGPDFASRLRAAGALLVLASGAGDAVCGA
jgi:hypothetical protein